MTSPTEKQSKTKQRPDDAPVVPDRIKPFFETAKPGELVLLFQEDATVTQKGKSATGRLIVFQEWSPMRFRWELAGSGLSHWFGEVDIAANSFSRKGYVTSVSDHLVAGYFDGPLEMGSGVSFHRVIFHLPNYPDLFVGPRYSDVTETGSNRVSTTWDELVLQTDRWRIRLQPIAGHNTLRKAGQREREVVLGGVGEIRRLDGKSIKKKDALSLLEALRMFLSFAFGEWSPPILIAGLNKSGRMDWQRFINFDVVPPSPVRGWLDERYASALALAFPGFIRLWDDGDWREPLELTIHWLIEATRISGGIRGAIALSQIPLEMLSWLVFVESTGIIAHDEFDRLGAASKLQLLLSHCGIPFEVPANLSTLGAFARCAKSKQAFNGPQAATWLRNKIIHPNAKNRKAVTDRVQQSGVQIETTHFECLLLFKWYITLVLLNQMGYSGRYASRLGPRHLGQADVLPWAAVAETDSE